MGVFEVTRGTEVYEIEAPDEATALKAFGQMISGAPAALAKEAPSIPMDMAKSAGSGLARGAAALPGLPADIGGLAQSGMDWLRSKMPGAPSLEEVQAQSRANAIISPETLANFGGQSMVKRLEENVTGPLYKPQTEAGKRVQGVAEFVPGALAGPGGLARNALMFGVAPGIASEAAGMVTGDHGGAKSGAALTTAAALALLTRRPGANAAISNATEGVKPAQIAQMEKLMLDAKQTGVPLTRAEALEQVAPGASRLLDLQHTVEGQGGLKPMMAARPGEIKGAAAQQFDTNLGPAAADRAMLGPQMGRAAEDVVIDANTARTAATDPHYKAAAADMVPPQEIDALIGRINGWINSDKTKLTHEPLEKLKQALTEKQAVPAQGATATSAAVAAQPAKYITDIENLDRVRKNFRDQTKLPAFAPNALDKDTGGKVGSIVRDLKTSLEAASPSFVQGKALHQQITKDVLDPLMAGPIGHMAKKDLKIKTAINELFPANPTSNAREITAAVTALAAKNPTAATQLVRAHVEKTFNNAMKSNIPGENQMGGAKFVAKLVGDPQQKANLDAAITALRGPQAAAGANRFFEILEATGKRQAIGSRTAFKTPEIENLKGGGTLATTAKAVLGAGVKIPAMVGKKFDQWNLGRNTDELARLLTDPAAAKVFRQLAGAPTTGNRALMYSMQLVLLSGRTQPSPQVRH